MATNDKRTLLTEVPTPKQSVLTDALSEPQSSRDKAIGNAHKALVDAFGPKLNAKIVENLTQESLEIAENDIEELIKELNIASEDDDMVKECRRRIDEAKNPTVPTSEKERMYRDIHRKFWAYVQSLPKRENLKDTTPRKLVGSEQAEKKFRENKSGPIQWISYEGSMIICSLISVSDDGDVFVNMSQLPMADRDIILNMTNHKVSNGFRATMDEYKNFDCYIGDNVDKESSSKQFTLGNRVATTPPHESSRFGTVDVKVERKGKEILIGDRIKLERQRIQEMVKTETNNNSAQSKSGFQPRPKVAGRNAYEIRSDVLEMALDWAKSRQDKNMDSDDVLDIAEAFYSFVEHK